MKKNKGEYGYLRYKKIRGLFFTVLYTLIGIAIFILGLALNKWEKGNIFTVVAVMMVLPAAKALVGFIALFPFRQTSESLINELKEAVCGMKADIYYDAVFSNKDGLMHCDVILFNGEKIIGYCSGKKDNPKKIQSYFEEIFKKRMNGFSAFITNEKKVFFRAVENNPGLLDGDNLSEDQKDIAEFLRVNIL